MDRERSRGDLLAGPVVLLPGDRGGGDAAAVILGGMDGQAAPAGADLDDVVRGLELQEAAKTAGLPTFRGTQLASWLYKKNVFEWEEIKNFSKADRDRLDWSQIHVY